MNKLLVMIKKELMELFRDKKSLAMMLVIPIMIPFLIIGLSCLFDMQMNKDESEYNKIGFGYELSESELTIAKELGIEVVLKSPQDLKSSYEKGDVHLYITRDDNKYIINGDNNDTTSYALLLVKNYFNIYKEFLQREYLGKIDILPDEVINIIEVEENITEQENFFANYIITYGFLFIIMAITVASTYPATDATAGEKERGTLETLFTFPIKARDIIIGKYLCVVLSNIITGLLSLILFIISLAVANNMLSIYEGVKLIPSLN